MCSLSWELSKGELCCGTSQNPRGNPREIIAIEVPGESAESQETLSRLCWKGQSWDDGMLPSAPGRQLLLSPAPPWFLPSGRQEELKDHASQGSGPQCCVPAD